MKVSHLGDEHLLCLTSEEVALLVDLCHAAIFSDELGASEGRSPYMRRFMADMQGSLFSTAQDVWRRRHRQGEPPAAPLPPVEGPGR